MKIVYDMIKKVFGGDSVSNGFRKFSVCLVFSFLVWLLFSVQLFTTKNILTDTVFAGIMTAFVGGFYASNTLSKRAGAKDSGNENDPNKVKSMPPDSSA